MIEKLEKEIREQFGADKVLYDPFNMYSFMFDIKFSPYFGVVFEVEKIPEVDCYILTHSGHFTPKECVGTGRHTLNSEKELLSKLKEVLEEYNKVSDILNNLYKE